MEYRLHLVAPSLPATGPIAASRVATKRRAGAADAVLDTPPGAGGIRHRRLDPATSIACGACIVPRRGRERRTVPGIALRSA